MGLFIYIYVNCKVFGSYFKIETVSVLLIYFIYKYFSPIVIYVLLIKNLLENSLFVSLLPLRDFLPRTIALQGVNSQYGYFSLGKKYLYLVIQFFINLKHLNQHRYPGYSLEMNLASVGQLT